MSRKTAVILAGGRGTRLRPYTWVLPKPLMPIGEIPILEIVIRQLKHHGFTRIILAVNHQAEMLQAVMGDGSKYGVRIEYSLEKKPLSTMGPLRLMKKLPEHFLVMNGDILTDLNYTQLYRDHVKSKKIFTISSYRREQKVDYGVLHVGVDGKLMGFEEKPVQHYQVSMGVYMVSKKVLSLITPNVPFGFDHLMAAMLKKAEPVGVRLHRGLWLDIGRPDDYMEAMDVFSKRRRSLLKG